MNDTLIIRKKNEVHFEIITERSIEMELGEFFKFRAPNFQFNPKYKSGWWDGYIRLFNSREKTIPCGLLQYIEQFAKERSYHIEYEFDNSDEEFSVKEANEFIESLNTKFKPRDYQLKAFINAVRKRRSITVSPTGSGKSFIIYLLARYYEKKTLIIVPNVGLINQMYNDFADYGFDVINNVHRIYSGKDKTTNKRVVISTWQSIYKFDSEFFKEYDVVIGDEVHLFQAKSLVSIMENMKTAPFRFGFTGTLHDTKTHKLSLEGSFGQIYQSTTTHELIKQNHLSEFQIKVLILKHSKKAKEYVNKQCKDYDKELKYIISNPSRNKFIKNLSLSLEGNTLILYRFVEKHGKILYDMIKKNRDNVFFIHGGIDGEYRNDIRHSIEQMNDAIIIASYGTFSEGINIKNLHNIIFASPYKSKVKNLQSIGRALRKGDNKEKATLYDIVDDLSNGKKQNHAIKHFMSRIEIYNKEKFDYKIYNIGLKDGA